MNPEEVRKYCMTFPDATENLQWGDDLCFKIRGKIFTILSLDIPRLCFKCTPEVFAELIEREDIHPAPYVGRYKWVMLDHLDALNRQELWELIQQSFEIVAAKASKEAGKRSVRGRTTAGKKKAEKKPGAAPRKGKKKR